MKSLEQIASEETAYQPNASVKAQMSHVPLVCVVGGVGVGKNYLMQRTGLPIVGRVTSRAKRPDDNPLIYTYYSNETFIKLIENQELIQYAVDLRNNTIYGSTLANYVVNTPNLADIWHWSVEELPNKGFQSVRAISIITPVEQWREQLATRFEGRDAAFQKARLEEAKESVLWTRKQIVEKNPNHAVIINDKNNTANSVHTLFNFANGATEPTPVGALELIDKLLDFLGQ